MQLLTLPSSVSIAESDRVVPIPAKHTAADVVPRAGDSQAAHPHPRGARPRLPPVQLHLHRQQLHPCFRICSL